MSDNNNSSVAATIASSLPVVGNVFNAVSQGIQNKKNREFQAAENQKDRDFNKMMWDLNNAYNSPVAQMSRLKDAGINPHLAYSNGSPMNTSNAPVSAHSNSLPPGMAARVNSQDLANMMLTLAQVKNINSDTEKKEAEKESLQVNTSLSRLDLDNYYNRFDAEIALKNSQVGLNQQQIINMQEALPKLRAETENIIKQNEQIQKQIDLIATQIAKTEEEKKLVTASIVEAYSRVKYNQQLSAESRSREQLNKEISKNQTFIRSNIAADTNLKTEQFRGLQTDNYVKNQTSLSIARSNADYAAFNSQKVLSELRKIDSETALNVERLGTESLNQLEKIWNMTVGSFPVTTQTSGSVERVGGLTEFRRTTTRRR